MISLLPTETASDVGGLAVLIPPLYEIFWSTVIILLLWIVLGRSLPKIYAKIDERREQINTGLEAASKAKSDAAQARREREDLLRDAAQEARDIRDQAEQDAKRIVAQAREDANAEAARIQETADKRIAASSQAAAIALRQDVGELATELAEKIVGEALTDKELSSRVIDRFMDELEEDMASTPTGADA